MSQRSLRLLVACDSAQQSQLLEERLTAAGNLRVLRCELDQVDSRLRDPEMEAIVLAAPQFEEELPGAIRRWKTARSDLEVLLVFESPPGTREIVSLMRAGAFDVVDAGAEPALAEGIANLLRRVDEVRAGSTDRQRARQSLAALGLAGESAMMENLFVQLVHAARLSCTVMISGQPGCGKRLAAHAIHALSPRNTRPVMMVDCSSLSPALLDAALFGAPSAEESGHGGLLETARHGTLVLHEVGDTPYAVQLELLRKLESGDTAGAQDVRIISTTSRRIDELVELRSFRADLCYRLNVLPLDIPPLRRRIEDVPLLARHFLSRHERDNRAFTLAEDAVEALCQHSWPGNVGELKAAMEYAVAHSVDDTIVRAHLPPPVTGVKREPDSEGFASSELNLSRLEQQAILRALQVSGFDKAKAARLLGVGKTTMYRKLKEMSSANRKGVAD